MIIITIDTKLKRCSFNNSVFKLCQKIYVFKENYKNLSCLK